ncbi:hypothetical protein AZOA_29550 [Azoarcus sp. Aa7]|nr:hypothetical protein [Azoarcus sp. Aa7]
MLRPHFARLGLIATGLLLAPATSSAVTCSKAGFDELNRDKANTAYFLDATAEKACTDQPFAGAGTVNQVYGKDEFEITADDGLRVTVILGANHGCGDLLNMRKGQRVRIKGTVSRSYRAVGAIRLKEAACVLG